MLFPHCTMVIISYYHKLSWRPAEVKGELDWTRQLLATMVPFQLAWSSPGTLFQKCPEYVPNCILCLVFWGPPHLSDETVPLAGLTTSQTQSKIIIFSQKGYFPLYVMGYVRDMLLTLLLDGIHILTATYKTRRYFSRSLRKWDWGQSVLTCERGRMLQGLNQSTMLRRPRKSHMRESWRQFRNSPLSLELANRSPILQALSSFPSFSPPGVAVPWSSRTRSRWTPQRNAAWWTKQTQEERDRPAVHSCHVQGVTQHVSVHVIIVNPDSNLLHRQCNSCFSSTEAKTQKFSNCPKLGCRTTMALGLPVS